jgi:hypothetical protein
LEVLALEDTRVKGAGLKHLKGLSRLRVLDVGGCGLTDDALAHLEPLTSLETLALQDTKITGAGLAHLSGLSELRVLNLDGCEVTAESLEHLRPLANLRILRLKLCPVTAEEAKQFKSGMEGLAIFR